MNVIPFRDPCVTSCPVSPRAPAWVLAVVIGLNYSRSPDKAWRARSLLPYQLGESIPGHYLVLNRSYCVIGHTGRDPRQTYYGGFHVNQIHYDIARGEKWINAGGYFFGDNPWDSSKALRAYREKIELFIAPWTILQGEMST
jgi:hypothetical protein